MAMQNEISCFYQGKNVLITGGTGFVGKVLIQKLLRSCKDIHLYLLMRPKKGLTVDERARTMFDDLIFETMRKVVPDFLAHITVIEGDISCESLGISPDNAKLLEEKTLNLIRIQPELFKYSLDTCARLYHQVYRPLLVLTLPFSQFRLSDYLPAMSEYEKKQLSEVLPSVNDK